MEPKVNELYKMTDDDVELCLHGFVLDPLVFGGGWGCATFMFFPKLFGQDYYLPQLSQVALLRYNKSSLHRFLLDKATCFKALREVATNRIQISNPYFKEMLKGIWVPAENADRNCG